ncbi:hypothetical protein J132_04628, partial [Termitomyces sp. J132]
TCSITPSKLVHFCKNDGELFPSREAPESRPIFTPDKGRDEFLTEKIVESRRRGRGWQYLVSYVGFGPGHDEWLASKKLEENAALEVWLTGNGSD